MRSNSDVFLICIESPEAQDQKGVADHVMETDTQTADQPKELSKSQLKKLQWKWSRKRKTKRLHNKKRKSHSKW